MAEEPMIAEEAATPEAAAMAAEARER